MRYNNAYAKHVNIEIKLKCNILKKCVYAVEATLWILDALH